MATNDVLNIKIIKGWLLAAVIFDIIIFLGMIRPWEAKEGYPPNELFSSSASEAFTIAFFILIITFMVSIVAIPILIGLAKLFSR